MIFISKKKLFLETRINTPLKRLLFFILLIYSFQSLAQDWETVDFNITESYCDPLDYTEIFLSEIYDCQDGGYVVIELFNPTANPIVLTGNYSLKKYALPGTSTPLQRGITGTIQPFSTFLIVPNYTSGSSSCLCPDAVVGDGSFPNSWGINERDKIELIKNSTVIDQWIENHNVVGYTYTRKADVVVPKQVYNPADWNFTNQGSSTAGCYSIGMDNTVPPIRSIEIISCTVPTKLKITMEDNGPVPYHFELLDSSSSTVYSGPSNTLNNIDLDNDTYTLIISGDNSCTVTIEFEIDTIPAITSPVTSP